MTQQPLMNNVVVTDSATTIRSAFPISIEDEDFLKNSSFYKENALESSPLFEPDQPNEQFIFSPTALSAGPAAAAAGAARAACFGNSAGGFTDASNAAKSFLEEPRSEQVLSVQPKSRPRLKMNSFGYSHHEVRGMNHSAQMLYPNAYYGNMQTHPHYYIPQ